MDAPVVAVVGSRDGIDADLVRAFVRRLQLKYPAAVVLSGGARGVDRVAAAEADKIGLGLVEISVVEQEEKVFWHTVTWNEQAVRPLHQLGLDYISALAVRQFTSYPHAAYARNILLVQLADQVVAFWNGSSRGTMHTISVAGREGKPLFVNPNLTFSDAPPRV